MGKSPILWTLNGWIKNPKMHGLCAKSLQRQRILCISLDFRFVNLENTGERATLNSLHVHNTPSRLVLFVSVCAFFHWEPTSNVRMQLPFLMLLISHPNSPHTCKPSNKRLSSGLKMGLWFCHRFFAIAHTPTHARGAYHMIHLCLPLYGIHSFRTWLDFIIDIATIWWSI